MYCILVFKLDLEVSNVLYILVVELNLKVFNILHCNVVQLSQSNKDIYGLCAHANMRATRFAD